MTLKTWQVAGALVLGGAMASAQPCMAVAVEAAAQSMQSMQSMQPKMMGSTPTEGQKAPDFSLAALDGQMVKLSAEVARGPVVLVVLRGFPGYQCPLCTRQFGEYLTRSSEITAAGAQVLFVYPGAAEGLKERAMEFVKASPLPAAYRVMPDPGYVFTNAYGLRWDAKNETAYPSTFVIDKGGMITMARTSKVHGDRVPLNDVLAALAKLKR